MPRFYFVLPLALAAATLAAQQMPAKSPTPKGLAPAPSADRSPAKLADAINASYYRADSLMRLECQVSVDWATFFNSAKLSMPPDRMKLIEGLKISSHAVRGKVAQVSFDWTAGPMTGSDQVEEGLKQMVRGFYQFYWPLFASPLVNSADEFKKVEPLADGSSKIYETSQNMNVVITIDKDGVPLHYSFDSPAMKGTIDTEYVPSPQPVAGDLRRMSSARVAEQIGTSNINMQIGLDYQPVGSFNLPKHVSFEILGAYSVAMEFSGCTASTAVVVNQ